MRTIWQITTFVAAFTILNGGQSLCAVKVSDGEGIALNVIIGDDVIAKNVHAVRQQAATMSPQERFDFLSKWVLPSADHSSLRMHIEFTLVHPPPPMAFDAPATGRMIQTGGDVVTPAIDLVTVAKQLNRLDELRGTLEGWQPLGVDQQKASAAFRVILSIAEEDFEAAVNAMQQLFELSGSNPVSIAELGPETVAMWVGKQHSQTLEAARDLGMLVFEDVRQRSGTQDDCWHRQMFSLKQWFQAEAEAAQHTRPDSDDGQVLKNWQPVSRTTAKSRGSGYPLAGWKTQRGMVQHVTSHDEDYLYYRIPLAGEFTVEADLSPFNFRDIRLGLGSYWAGPSYTLDGCRHGSFRKQFDTLPLDPPLAEIGNWLRTQIVVKDGVRRNYTNGRLVYEREHTADADPWLSIHSLWYTNGVVRNLSISGAVVPDEIDLIAREDLPGWLPYYDETAGRFCDWRREKANSSFGDTAALRGRRNAFADTNCESLLRYHRPMLEDGFIEYDFLYNEGGEIPFHTHPALDRLVFLISPDGVRVHWTTDGRYDTTGLEPANVLDEPDHRRGPKTLPLKTDGWNRLRITLTGDRADLHLNGQMIYSRLLEPTNQRTFGLFHYADQAELRVKNVRWQGEWPKQLPDISKQELVDDPLDSLNDRIAELPVFLDHNFENGLPPDHFTVLYGKLGDTIREQSDGVFVRRPAGKGYLVHGFGAHVQLQGDFDVTARFENLVTAPTKNGHGNCHLLIAIEDDVRSECRIYRRDNLKAKRIWSSVFRHIDGQTRHLYPKHRRESAPSGSLRLVRHGNQMHYLFAAYGSSSFRLLDTQEVGTGPTPLNGIRLFAEVHDSGDTAVLWKHLTIRAESIFSETAPPTTVEALNERRDQLPVTFVHDFTKDQAIAEDFEAWGGTKLTAPDGKGLLMEREGSEGWQWSGLSLRKRLHGDFDVTVDLEPTRMDAPQAGGETTLIMLTEFVDRKRPSIEIKYLVNDDGAAFVRGQQRVSGQNGLQQANTVPVESIHSIRTARRGEYAYYLYREKADADWKVLAGVRVSTTDVLKEKTTLLLHTGGVGRKSEVRILRTSIATDVASPDTRP